MAKLLSPKVFVNFGGEELRHFIWHLGKALRDGGIRFFVDEQFDPSDDPQTFFKQHIEDSKIALAVFSKRYPESELCLNDLVKIMEKVEENKLKVIPIFFKVNVDDVKQLTGEFGRNFHRGDHRDRSNMLQWRKALRYLTDKKGLCWADYRRDIDFIAAIVLAVKQVIANISPVSTREGTNMLSKSNPLVTSSENIITRTNGQPSRNFPLCGIQQQFVDHNVSLPQQHQVFISFRGEQLRNNFVSHLVDALRRNEINVFIDKQENKGEDISNLLKRIEDSKIAIVVFSSKYTESKWCLREAEKIMERVAQVMLKVLPIFYKVTTTNVKLLKGEFGDHFRDQEWDYHNDKAVIEKWKKALVFISDKIGFTLDEKSDETDFIASIVNEVLKMQTSIQLAKQTEESHANRFLDKGETSTCTFCGISSGTAQSYMDMSGLANLVSDNVQVLPNQSSYRTATMVGSLIGTLIGKFSY